MIQAYVVAASSYAQSIDNLIYLIGGLVGFWFILCYVLFFGFIWKFRAREGRKSQYITGENKVHKRWISLPHILVLVCDVFIVYGAVRVWTDVKQTLPPPDATIRVIGQQWAWTFVHPGPDGKLGSADDITTIDELNVEIDKVYHFDLESKDVLHSFSVPVFRLKQDAVPGRIIRGWFRPTKTGEYDIQCAEICGIGHGIMAARIKIQSAQAHAAWIQGQSSSTRLAAR
jgi:cytochrome c oxidase subunit 2